MKISIKIVTALLISSVMFNNSGAQDASMVYRQNKTVTYTEAIAWYQSLAAKYPKSKLITCGNTDSGKPLHLFVITNDGDFNPSSIHKKNKSIILVNNGIHPGEPCGIDACLKLSKDLLTDTKMQPLLEHTVICIIPVFNIDGALNRNSLSRVNQNGPEEYGFRGNARHLDLNRDFIKCDAENTKSFVKIFREWQPEVFIDTHISNGADYQYTLTYIETQPDKLHPVLAEYTRQKLVPQLNANLKSKNVEASPYVDCVKESPDSGIIGFLETPRFASGYTTLFNTIGFISETHMLKPYPAQVEATYKFIEAVIGAVNSDYRGIIAAKKKADEDCASAKLIFDLQWKLDFSKYEMLNFKGYAAKYKTSLVTGLERLYYDRNEPYEKQIKYHNSYEAAEQAMKPFAYIIPQCWQEVIERMNLNKVKMNRLVKDTVIKVQSYYITNYKTAPKPYEGHYLHSDVETRDEEQQVALYKGDYVIYCNQPSNRYIVETCEPKGVDSWFAWNFFDAVLQQKEGFSSYVFEEKAEEVLNGNPVLRDSLTEYVIANNLEQNAWQQLMWIYQHSKYMEPGYLRYPIFRINEKTVLPAGK